MKKVLVILLLLFPLAHVSRAEYTDHRNRQVDSLENVIVGWTEDRVAAASPEELDALIFDYRNLMSGYESINPDRAVFFARKLISVSLRAGNLKNATYGAQDLGQHHWAAGQLDSADYYFRMCLDFSAAMAATVGQDGGYEQIDIDDQYSRLYGALGNLAYTRDDIPAAMEYYRKAGEIFDRYGWNESNAVLYHNMGEIWAEQGDLARAKECQETALHFGTIAGDSLWMSSPKISLAEIYFQQGKTTKALQYIKEADEYYSKHEDLEFRDRIATLDVMGKVLAAQKRQRTLIAVIAALLALGLLGLLLLTRRAVRLGKEKRAADEAIGEALAVLEISGQAGDDARPSLSEREMEILPLIASGMTSKQIAVRICVTEQTIKWRRQRLLMKLDARNTAEMLIRAKEHGLL